MEDFGLRLSSPSTRDTAKFTLDPSLCKDPSKPIVLIVRHAGLGNGELMSAVTKQGTGRPAQVSRETANQIAREEDAALYASTVIVGWEGIPGEFSADRVKAFLLYLVQPRQSGEKDADYSVRIGEFNRLRAFCNDTGTFRDPIGSSEELGKG